MDTSLSDTHNLITRARDGDWDGVEAQLDVMSREPLPHSSAALHDRARLLEQALTAARSAQADLAASVLRLDAASRFGDRQDFVGSTGFWHPVSG